jgi:hypothetical protein
MGTSQREETERRAIGAMLREAFFSWPSAVTIGFTMVMFALQVAPFDFWQNWMWLVFGVLAEGAYLWSTLTDPVAAQQAVARMLQEKYDPGDIRNLHARTQLKKALEYKTNIDAFVARQSGALKEDLGQSALEINKIIAQIYELAKSIDMFEGNEIISRDRRTIPTDLANLKRRYTVETDAAVKHEIAEAIETREKLVASLKTIESNAKRTEIRMDNSVAQLSTFFAQMQLLNSRELDSGRARRLREDIREEIAQLNDVVSSMREVFDYGSSDYSSAVSKLEEESADSEAAGAQAEDSARRASKGNA